MKRLYEAWNPSANAQALINHAEGICHEYQQQGYNLTLRQLYYQFVARGLIPNTIQSYKNLGSVINKARLAGLIDWNMIVDRTRNLRSLSHWANPQGVINAAAASYANDLWADQPRRVEVWVEKEALAGVIERAAAAWDVPWFCCRGYVSQSEQWAAGRRLGEYLANGQRVTVIHLGDHDPSGVDMTRDIDDRLARFVYTDWLYDMMDDFDETLTDAEITDAINAGLRDEDYGAPLTIKRIALNMDQVTQYRPPPNPAKLTDSRCNGYIARYGRQSWELDALDPTTLNRLISDEISALVDHDRFEAAKARQETDRRLLQAASRGWTSIAANLNAN